MAILTIRPATALVLAGLFAAIACADGSLVDPLRDDLPLQTDRLVYTLSGDDVAGWQVTLVVRYENRRPSTVYMPGCYPEGPVRPLYGFRRAAPDTARVLFSTVWACVGGVSALAIHPGEVRIDTVEFVSLVSPAAVPPDDPRARIGFMQVGYELYAGVTESGEADYRTLLPESERLSNVFEIRYPE